MSDYYYPPGCTQADIDHLAQPSPEEYYLPDDPPAPVPCGICQRAIVASEYDNSPKNLCNTCWAEIFTFEDQNLLKHFADFWY